MCYHVSISHLVGVLNSFQQLYFTINHEKIFCFYKKNAVFMRRMVFGEHLI